MICKRMGLLSILLTLLILAVLPATFSCTNGAETPDESPTPDISTPVETEETIEIKWALTSVVFGAKEGWHHTTLWNNFAQGIEERTDGRVKFVQLVGATSAPEMYDSIINGVGDIGNSAVPSSSGRFPLAELMTICDFFTECQRPARVAAEMYKQIPEVQDEFSDVKILTLYGTTPSPPGIGFATVDKPIYTMEDAAGVKIGAYGMWLPKMASALGFSSVGIAPTAAYESIQKKLVDGSFMDAVYITTRQIGELVNYWHPVSAMFVPMWLGMNMEKWNSLPPDIQKIIEEQAEQVPEWADSGLGAQLPGVFEAYPDIEIIDIAPDERARWLAAQDPVQAECIDQLEENGLPGQMVFDKLNQLYAEYNTAQ